ncbi:hypothetical protein P280DRAFT_554215 [Massarina eburnea CBS 473.64]|uniref:Uncharacterized protein n=1 Tax=Massarina eburnea CBS 473.64 TaxID=1395130 RepID=A0A6A6RK54_9PLEO|nr:hypothetical protein P280DRAFT_554215 [Massarina eburnea CBS 473.64]
MQTAGSLKIICTVVAQTPYRPGVQSTPFPSSEATARVNISTDAAFVDAEDSNKPRDSQLASWHYTPIPRTSNSNNTDWVAGFEKTFHPGFRAAFNGTRYKIDGWMGLYKGFGSIIGQNYVEWQQWRDYCVASPDSWNSTSRGGVVNTQGFNGGVVSGANGRNVTSHAPNAGYFVD